MLPKKRSAFVRDTAELLLPAREGLAIEITPVARKRGLCSLLHVGVFWFLCSRWLDSIVLGGDGGVCVGRGGMEAESWSCPSFLLTRTVLTAGGPLGMIGGAREPGAGGMGGPRKSPAFPMAQTPWAPAAFSIPDALKHLAETSPHHIP